MDQKPPAPKKGDPASLSAIAQMFLDSNYEALDSMELADIVLRNWDVRWKENADGTQSPT